MKQRELIEALAGEPDSAERAALELFESPQAEAWMGDAETAGAVRRSVSAGNHSGAAILLLGLENSPEGAALLMDLRESGRGELAKLQPWTPAVPLPLVADVALSRRGVGEARTRLLAEIENAELATLAFLLGVLEQIDAPEVLHAVSRTLDDGREVSAGVPSGAAPARRLADEAVDAFIDRLNLTVGFSRNASRRYSEEEIDQVRQAILRSVPQ